MSYVKGMISTNFIEYASYVIKERAIPDICDGLKPVQRRILHSLYEVDDGKFNKVANVVGNTMKYHPHGDASIYSSLVVLANKELFIEKQGNFGNILTGDDASAARYIECRLSPLARQVLFNSDLTEYSDSYDGRNKEPVSLPAKIPNLLLMGAEGIAVGMSTRILPHNFTELLNAQIKILKKEKFTVYPDFQQGGTIDVSNYEQGNGKVRVRAVIEVKDNKTLIIKEIPYSTTTQSLISSIETAAKKGKVKINAINDYTAETVEIELKISRGETAEDVLKSLYAYTDCEQVITVSLITIVDNKPKILAVNEVLEYNTQKLVADLQKELEIEQEKLQQQLHDLTLEQIFIENRIYKKIEELTSYDLVTKTIMKEMNKYKELFIRKLIDADIEKLLQIRIKRISRFDIENHKKNIDDIIRSLDNIQKKLKDVKKYAITYLKELITKYSSNFPRKTKIMKMETISIKEISQADVKVYWDKKGGFLGTEVRSEDYFTVTPYEKFLVISKEAKYSIVTVENKKFVDTNTLYLNIWNDQTTFSVIYTDMETNIAYAKKFKVAKFIQNKIYNLAASDKARIDYISTNPEDRVKMFFEKKKGQKVHEKEYDFKQLEMKGVSARGNKVTDKIIQKVIKLE